MHRCLSVIEILHAIFSAGYLAPDPSPRVPKVIQCPWLVELEYHRHWEHNRRIKVLRTQTLASLAITCRWFQEPALQALWYQLDDLAPLIKCMPGDLWEVSHDGMHKKITLRRPIRATDWAIFDKYAPRVRTLILWCPVLELHDPTLLSIFARTHSAPLLPELELLRCHDYTYPKEYLHSGHQGSTEDLLHFLISLFSPTLVSVSMTIQVLDNMFGLAAVEYLIGSCPSLKHFDLIGCKKPQGADGLACGVICNLVQSHPYLQSMRCGVLDEQAISEIAELASLKQFSLHINGPIFEGGLTLPTPNFRRLTWLRVVAPNLGSALSFIRLVQSPLEEIVLYVTQTPSPDILQEFSTVVSRRFSSDCLTSIILEVFDLNSTPLKFAIDYIRPLLGFRRMKNFALGGARNLWDDDSILELMVAWPELERLSLRSSPWNTGALTLRSLLLLLKHRPGLREIEIFFDATSVPSADEFGGDWPSNNNIKEIYLSDSDIADPSVVAFLCTVLPSLTCIHCNDLDMKDIVSEYFEKQRKSVDDTGLDTAKDLKELMSGKLDDQTPQVFFLSRVR